MDRQHKAEIVLIFSQSFPPVMEPLQESKPGRKSLIRTEGPAAKPSAAPSV